MSDITVVKVSLPQSIATVKVSAAPGLLPTRRHAFAAPNDYMGVAPQGTPESSPVWTITRQTVAANGTAQVAVARNVTWTGYASHNYN